MKTAIKTMLEAHIRDNKSYIKSYTETGNIYQYLVSDLTNMDQGHEWYLTDEESEAWRKDESEAERLSHEIYDLIEQYNYSIDKFIGEEVIPA